MSEDNDPKIPGWVLEMMEVWKDKEFAAQCCTPWEFAEVYKSEVRLWGHPPKYLAVKVSGTDYLWRIKDGKYDGWDRHVADEFNQ